MKRFITAILALSVCSAFALEDIPLPQGGDFYGVGGRDGQTVADMTVTNTLTVGNTIKASGGVYGVGNGTAAAGAASAVEVVPCVQKTVLTLAAISETFTAGSDEGESQLLYTFPEGRIYILGAAINAAVTNNAGFESSDNDHWFCGIGTAAAGDDATLSGTEQDIIAVQDNDTNSGDLGHFEWEADMTGGADSVFDGTSTAVKLYYNSCAANTSIKSGNATAGTQAGGTLTVYWINLGDD